MHRGVFHQLLAPWRRFCRERNLRCSVVVVWENNSQKFLSFVSAVGPRDYNQYTKGSLYAIDPVWSIMDQAVDNKKRLGLGLIPLH